MRDHCVVTSASAGQRPRRDHLVVTSSVQRGTVQCGTTAWSPRPARGPRWDHCVVTSGVRRGAVGCGTNVQHTVDLIHGYTLVSYNAGISACEKGKQWQRGLALFSEMRGATIEHSIISYNAGGRPC